MRNTAKRSRVGNVRVWALGAAIALAGVVPILAGGDLSHGAAESATAAQGTAAAESATAAQDTAAAESATANGSEELLGLAMRELPEEWGDRVMVYPAAARGLVVATFSPLMTDPDFAELSSAHEGGLGSSPSLLEEWSQQSGTLGSVVSVTTLWSRDALGVHLVAASISSLADQTLVEEEQRIDGLPERERMAAIQAWRWALLRWIEQTEDIEVAEMVAEIVHYGQLSGDDSVHDAWLSRMLVWGCEKQKEQEACDNCCEEMAETIRNWGCGVLVRPLATIGGCFLAGGSISPLTCSIAGTVIGAAAQAACKALVTRKERECLKVCEKTSGKDEMSLQW